VLGLIRGKSVDLNRLLVSVFFFFFFDQKKDRASPPPTLFFWVFVPSTSIPPDPVLCPVSGYDAVAVDDSLLMLFFFPAFISSPVCASRSLDRASGRVT